MLDIKNLKIGDEVVLVGEKVGYKLNEKLIIVRLDNTGLKPKVGLKHENDSNIADFDLEDFVLL